MNDLQIVKIGGSLVDDQSSFSKFLDVFTCIKEPKILVHGGGKQASQLSKSLGVKPMLVDGRRITDAPTLNIVTMVYAGLINKNIVAKLQAKSVNALGLSGADLNVILSLKRSNSNIDFGWVGDVKQVNTESLNSLIDSDCVPVFCPITHDKKGQLLNTNADTIAAELAKALCVKYSVSLKYCFEYPGVMNMSNSQKIPIPHINRESFETLKINRVVHSGMLPKIENALSSFSAGVHKVAICGIDNLLTEKNVTWIG